MTNWLGNVRALGLADLKGEEDDNMGVCCILASLWYFQLMLVKMVNRLGPVVIVIEKGGKGVGKGKGEEQERIVGGALGLKPGADINPSPLTLFCISMEVDPELGAQRVRCVCTSVGICQCRE
jgi:hypothetical protein